MRGAREPVLGQLKLAWWRERLGEDSGRWPKGEPLLALLRELPDPGRLVALVDGWEGLLAGDGAGFAGLADGRAAAVAALFGGEAGAMARGWALGTLAGLELAGEQRAELDRLIATHSWHRQRLPRALRPLAVLHHFARRAAHGQGGGLAGAIRLGLIGR